MIIKGTALSAQPRLWQRAAAMQPAPVSHEVSAAPSAQVVTPPLDLGQVCDWLEIQDAAIRRAVALQLEEDLERLRVEGRREGREAGERDGRLEVQKESVQLLKVLAGVHVAYERQRSVQLTILAETAEEVAVAALSRLVGPIAASREGVTGAVLEVLSHCPPDATLRICVSAADLPVLQGAQEQIALALHGAAFEFVPDPRVQVGGCLVETDQGDIDGRLETQLARLGALILEYKRASDRRATGP